MIEEEVLLPLLQFVALLAPAIALLMQLMENSDQDNAPALRFLEFALLFSIIGAAIILIRLTAQIQNFYVLMSIYSIFAGLFLLTLGMTWWALPGTENYRISPPSVEDLPSSIIHVSGRIFILILPFTPILLYTAYYQDEIDRYFNHGFIKNIDYIEPSQLFLLFLVLFGIRLTRYLIAVGYLSEYSFKDALYESTIGTISGYTAIILMGLIPFGIVYILDRVFVSVLSLGVSEIGFTLAYCWVTLLAIVMFYADLWGENEDEERLAA